MMKGGVVILDKKEGETPLEALEVFRRRHKEYKDVKMTYAGRLDPMASGVLLVLTGEEVKNKEKYLALDKEYEFQILFGFATDTHDILGKVTNSTILTNSRIDLEKQIKQNLKHFTGRFRQEYPLYSSKTIKKARAGVRVEREARTVNVKSLKFLKLEKINNKKLLANIERRIKKVEGDFRQAEILKIWRGELNYQGEPLVIAKFKIKSSSGTYVRGIADALGKRMKIPALAFSIKRTKVGKWAKEE
jgi:tRNA pseudouridine55 synthase